MKTATKQKAIRSIIGILIAAGLFFSSGLKLPVLETKTDAYFRKAITEAGLAYATCRVINASVSVVKDSNLQLGPMGVGISLAVGQVLDPIDDMTERLSDVLVTAITSLGVQKLAYEISVAVAPPVLAVLIFVLSLLIWFKNEKLAALHKNVSRFVLLIVIARLCLPMSSLANDALYHHFFTAQISEAKNELAIGSAELEKLKEWSLPEVDGILGTIENNASFLKQKAIEFKNAIAVTVSNMGGIIESLLRLTFLYVGLFIIQVVALPLLSFWFLVKTANALFETNLPVRLNHSRPSNNKAAHI